MHERSAGSPGLLDEVAAIKGRDRETLEWKAAS
jgi:hypothetical protein